MQGAHIQDYELVRIETKLRFGLCLCQVHIELVDGDAVSESRHVNVRVGQHL